MKRAFFVLMILFVNQLFANDTTIKKVYMFEIREEISRPAWRKTDLAFKQAEKEKADYILLQLNTFGGTLDDADKIRTRILASKIPVFVWIDINAASAGALIAIACDSIYMNTGATMGAATVVDQTGEVQPDKYQSYMRGMMRSTAVATGRDPRIAEAMVDPRIYIEQVNDSGKVLTFTADEAMANHYCQGKAQSIEGVLALADVKNYQIIEQHLSALDKIIHFLINPFISGILIMLIIGGIYFEMQTPGIGFPLVIAIAAALLFFAPLYLEGLAAHWEILFFIVGVILLALEIFVIPGFGVAGISGIILIITGLTLSLIDNVYFDFSGVSVSRTLIALSTVIIAITSGFILCIYLGKKILTTNRFGELALQTSQEKEAGYVAADLQLFDLVGQKGMAKTDLRPAGKVVIADETYDATAIFGYIEKGTEVEVIKYETAQLFVKKTV